MVVDDHRTLSQAIALALGAQPDMDCVGTATNPRDALVLVQATQPRAIVMDVRLDGGDGIQLTRRITADDPEVRVVVLTAYVDQPLLERAAEAEAVALLPKGAALSELFETLRTAPRGGFAVHPLLLRSLIRPGPLPKAPPVSLTPREQEVLGLLAQARDPSAIARSLGISVLTCRGYIKSLLAKLDAHSQLEAVVIALNRNLIQLDDVG